jgi:hypothetical protein
MPSSVPAALLLTRLGRPTAVLVLDVIALRQGSPVRTITVMTSPHWPLTGLVLRTPRIELRWPAPGDLDALAALAEEGIHDPGVQPFSEPWTDAPPAGRARSTLQYH